MRAVVLALSAQLALACAEPAPPSRTALAPAPRPVARAETPASASNPEAEAPAAAPASVSYAEATALAKQHCAECHQGSVSQAKPAALSVFDLDQGAWSAGLSAKQFQVFYQRMQGELDEATRARVLAFTESEAARVAALGDL